MSGETMQAIQTTYAGCLFRSRLEARWAVFFDTLGIEWQYEPQGFEVPRVVRDETATFNHRVGGTVRYLPDFWLPAQELWFEVKGSSPDPGDPWYSFAHGEYECGPCGTLSTLDGARTVMAVGQIPDPRNLAPTGHEWDGPFDIYTYSDEHYAWTRCELCGSYDVQFDARSARNYCTDRSRWAHGNDGGTCDHTDHGNGDKCYAGDAPEIARAYATARSARFEHDHRESW